jgi:tRNA threonylcarbamoyladenosine biosynthesis protein TsaB
MKVLGLDTALAACSVALIEGDGVLAALHETGPRGQAERLLPMTLAVLAKAGVGFAGVDRIGITIGPGSFSGIRIGLAAARGLAAVLNRPLVGIGTLRAIAAGVPANLRAGRVVAAAIEARRGDAYAQVFDENLVPLGEPVLLAKAEVARSFGGRDVVLAGDAAGAVRGLAPNPARFIIAPGTGNPDAVAVARLAARDPAPDRAQPPRPLYLRPPAVTFPAA